MMKSYNALKNNGSGLANAYKEIFNLGNKKFTSISQINSEFGAVIKKYSQYPEVMNSIVIAVNKAVKIVEGTQIKLRISTRKTIDQLSSFAKDALGTLSTTPKIDSLNAKYMPKFKAIQRGIDSSDKEVREDAIKTAAIVAKAYNKELNSLTQVTKKIKTKNTALIEYNEGLKIQADILKKAKAYVNNQNSQYSTYYHATKQYNKEWNYKKDTIETQYSMLKPDELERLVAVYKKDFFDKIKNEGKSTWEDMQATMKDTLTSGFEDFFNFTRDGFGDLKKLGINVVDAILNEIIKKQIAKPLASGISTAMGGLLNNIFGLANGGIMSNQGLVPLRAYSSGGIANSPQLAVYGEGRMNEAYVPLPDGKSIPVTMRGNSGNTYINVENKSGTPVDMQKLSESIGQNGDKTIQIVMTAIERNPDMRNAIKGIR